MNNWYVITGGPSTGKSTLLDELAKKGYVTIPEAARVIIDEAISKGKTVQELRKDEENFQHQVLDRKLKIEKAHTAETATFFDRGMHDTLAYLKLGGHTINSKVTKAMEEARYKIVFLLDPLEGYEQDYARTETAEESTKLNRLLLEAFSDYGMKPVLVPAMPVEERVQFVLRHID